MNKVLIMIATVATLIGTVKGGVTTEKVLLFSNTPDMKVSVPDNEGGGRVQKEKTFSFEKNGSYFLDGETATDDGGALVAAICAVKYNSNWDVSIHFTNKTGYAMRLYSLSAETPTNITGWAGVTTDNLGLCDVQGLTISKAQWEASCGQYSYTRGSLTYKPYVIYVKYEPNTYTVSFDGNGETSGSVNSQQFTYDQAQALNKNQFKREYSVSFNVNGGESSIDDEDCVYAFAGWATDESGEKVYNDQQVVSNLTASTGTVKLYAKWNQSSITLPSSSRKGYTFEGWYTKSSGGTKVGAAGDEYKPIKNETLYAHWSEATYKLTLNLNGAKWKADNTTTNGYKLVKYNAMIGDLPTKADMVNDTDPTFKGWFLASSGGTVVNPSDYYTWTDDITIFAQWDEDEGFLVNEEVLPSDKAGSITPGPGTYASGTTFHAVPAEGWSFAHWEDGTTATNRTIEFHGTKNITATFTGNVYKVTFLCEATEKMTTIYETFGDKYKLPDWDEEHFKYHWYADEDFLSEEITTDTEVTVAKKHTLYAKRIEDPKYTLAFDGNGATEGEMAAIYVYVDYSATLPANQFSRTGYAFAGWATKPDGEVEFKDGDEYESFAEEGDTETLYAVWVPITYSVRFDANGGSGEMADQAFTYDVAAKLTTNCFAKAVSGFYCWSNETDNATYTDGGLVSNLCTVASDVYELKAVWTNSLSDLSKAMHCDNLIWKSEMPIAEGISWLAKNEAGCGYNTDSCACAELTEVNVFSQYLVADCEAAGTLSFYWKVVGGDDEEYSDSRHLSITDENGEILNKVVLNTGWSKISVKVTTPGKVKLQVSTGGETATTISIDQMTWTPGSAHPEPEAKDAPSIGGFTKSDDGGFTLSFTNTSTDFDYNLLGTNLLTAPVSMWPVIETKTGSGEAMTFDIPLDATKPAMFYKVQVIQKQ